MQGMLWIGLVTSNRHKEIVVRVTASGAQKTYQNLPEDNQDKSYRDNIVL